LIQLHDSCAAPALILWCDGEPGNMRMIAEEFSDCFSKGARSVAVNYAHFGQAVQERRVEKLVRDIDRFVSRLADKIQFVILRCGI
jgi:hypothetical protein